MIYNSDEPSFHILICMIQVWNPADKSKPMTVPSDAMILSEVQSVEIEESYKKLIGTASVKFPRGTVIRKTVTEYNASQAAEDSQLKVDVSDSGIVETTRTSTSVAQVSNFKIGQRIRIYLGYTEDPAIASLGKVSNTGKNIFNDTASRNDYLKAMNNMFDGYITKVSVDTPIELHCENLASSLKQVSCPKVKIKSQATVNTLLADDGKYHLLKDTGLTLLPDSKAQKYDLGVIDLHPDLSVADLLTEWSKFGIHCFVTTYNGQAALAVGRTYFTRQSSDKDSIINAVSQSSDPVEIKFDYHVANNGLSLLSTDKAYLAVEATGVDSNDQFFHFCVLRNPQYVKTKQGEPYRVVNETKLSKKAMKLGVRVLSKAKDKVDMSLYTVVPYQSRKIPVDRDTLLSEAIKYLEGYNMNGIEGTLTLFGDLHLHTATKVHLSDDRYPGKNGYYLVDEVHTTFGTGGYRQNIKMPYCISRDSDDSSNNKES